MTNNTTSLPFYNLTVSANADRLDQWITEQIPNVSRSRAQKLINQGLVLVNEQICTVKKTKLKKGDRLILTIPANEPLTLEPEDIPLDILYEDQHLIIINKPAGLVVHPAPGHETGTLVHALLAHCHDLAGIGGIERPGIVHRLDKDTSGAIVVAKNDFAHQHLQGQIKSKTATRQYLGVIFGCPREDSGRVDSPIGRHPVERQKMAVVPLDKGGRASVTHWKIIERLGNYTLMQFNLETGRTHQIRVHCSALGFPLVGDPLYCSNRSIGVNLSGQALHAEKLCLQHPVTAEKIEAIAPLPADFIKLLNVLRGRIP